MKKIFVMVGICVLFLSAVVALAHDSQHETGLGTLKVVVDGCNNDKGTALISLYNSKETYNAKEKFILRVEAIIKNGKAEWIFKDIPFGSYVVKVLHDENNNKKLDFENHGFPPHPHPTEQGGFSNDAWSQHGQPAYEEAVFNFDKAKMTINITVKFW
jgi:uncharacterized protein (DUF2141 family)